MNRKQPECCIKCGALAVGGSHGLCRSCYSKQYAKTHAEEVRKRKRDWYARTKVLPENAERVRKWKYGPAVVDVLRAHDWRCAKCGSKEGVEVHHIDGRGSNLLKRDRNNAPSNLTVLCGSCHASLHGRVERWAKAHDKCTVCGTTEARHQANGRCTRCHAKHLYYRRTEGKVRRRKSG